MISNEQLAKDNALAISNGSMVLDGKLPIANASQIVHRQWLIIHYLHK